MKDIANYWLEKLAFGFAYETKYPQDVLSVRYEDILTDTENTVKKITNFIKIEYEATMLEANGLIVPEYTKHQHKLVGKQIDKSRVEAWKTALSPREIELFEYNTRYMLQLLNYDRLFIKPRGERTYERILPILNQKYLKFTTRWKERLNNIFHIK